MRFSTCRVEEEKGCSYKGQDFMVVGASLKNNFPVEAPRGVTMGLVNVSLSAFVQGMDLMYFMFVKCVCLSRFGMNSD